MPRIGLPVQGNVKGASKRDFRATFLKMEEQRLYSEILPSVWTAKCISKGVLHPCWSPTWNWEEVWVTAGHMIQALAVVSQTGRSLVENPYSQSTSHITLRERGSNNYFKSTKLESPSTLCKCRFDPLSTTVTKIPPKYFTSNYRCLLTEILKPLGQKKVQVLEIPLSFDCYKCSDRFGQNEFKCSVWWCNPNPSCQDLVSISAESLLFLYAGSGHHLTLMVLIAWKVCCGKKPTCKSCILDETHSRWAWALQSGLTLIKYQLALLLYLISCHIHTFTGLVEEK